MIQARDFEEEVLRRRCFGFKADGVASGTLLCGQPRNWKMSGAASTTMTTSRA